MDTQQAQAETQAETKAPMQTQTLVIGAGPGGYTAAFRAADLGQKVILVERYEKLGGVCLNVGCIPSKALLHVAKILDEAKSLEQYGINMQQSSFSLEMLRNQVHASTINKLTAGLSALAKQRKVTVVTGSAKFLDKNSVIVTSSDNQTTNINFENVIIAVGSRSIKLPFLPDDPRIMDSTGALALTDIPKELLIIGGGIIGMEMGIVYAALGSNVTVVELAPQLLGNVDVDLVAPLHKRMSSKFKSILLETKVEGVVVAEDGLTVTFAGKNAPEPQKFDKILQCVGRAPNSDLLDLSKAGVDVNQQGFITVDNTMRTNVAHIYAIGDVVGQPMLAHKSIPEGKVAAEVIAGKKRVFEPKCIPSVAYTDPEVAWVGLTEREAKEQGLEIEKAVFPWMASGRALAEGRSEGFTKLLFDKNDILVGAGIVGVHAGDLISEMALAIEMGCDVADIALTIHPHPTFAETMALAAEIQEGSITDLYMPKK